MLQRLCEFCRAGPGDPSHVVNFPARALAGADGEGDDGATAGGIKRTLWAGNCAASC